MAERKGRTIHTVNVYNEKTEVRHEDAIDHAIEYLEAAKADGHVVTYISISSKEGEKDHSFTYSETDDE